MMLADHLWQSTVFAGLAGLLTLAFKSNRAAVRHRVWMAASLKFLLPFAALMSVGGHLGWQPAPGMTQPQLTVVMDAIGQPFSQTSVRLGPETRPMAAVHTRGYAVPVVLFVVWFTGCGAVLLTWWGRWRRVAAIVRGATRVDSGPELNALRRLEFGRGIARPIAVVSSKSSLEPGVFGIWRPVLLWPQRMSEHLADGQIEAILAHEVSHVRRRDNLAAALHMVVEALFWFHPLVWWLGTQLVDESERACDEEVLRLGNEPQLYAESILKTCELYIASPLVCVAGVTGSDLKKRIERIMTDIPAQTLSPLKKLLLVVMGLAALVGPVMAGTLRAPSPQAQVTQAAAPATSTDNPTFEVASVKPNKSGDGRIMIGSQPNGRFTATNVTLAMLIRQAYQLQPSQIVGGPSWLNSDRFDIVAKAEGDISGPFPAVSGQGPSRGQLMMRALLADRFKLTVHTESRELPMYALIMARNDGRLGPQLRNANADCAALAAARRGGPPPPPVPGDPGGPEGPGEQRGPGGGRGPGDVQRLNCGVRLGPGNLAGGGMPMSQIATSLSMWVNRIVVDRTGLTGNFDFDLQWTPDQMPQGRGEPPPGVQLQPIDPNGPSIFTALQEQLGLKLDSRKGPVDILVIDRAEQPTED